MVSISIIYDFHNKPWGGGNQFLTLLKREFIKKGCYQKDANKAKAILFNSYQNLLKAIKIKIKFPNKFIIFRLGPVFYYHRGQYWKIMDKLVIEVANRIADLVIFQSNWSFVEAVRLGFNKSKNFSIIGNATTVAKNGRDNDNKHQFNKEKVKLFSDSWSPNWKKGFSFYKFLDNNLDFDRYEMTFVGNSPVSFKNIRQLFPLPPKELFKELKKNDIFVTATEDDACSNSIIEALSCGLPVVALNSGGNAEIIGRGGELFNNKKELIEKINIVKGNYPKYKKNISVKTMYEVGNEYIRLIKKGLYQKRVKQPHIFSLILLFFKIEVAFFLVHFLAKFNKLKYAH